MRTGSQRQCCVRTSMLPALLSFVLLLGSFSHPALGRWSPVSSRMDSQGLSSFGRRLQQLPVPASSQFDITGFIESATVNTPSDPLSGGQLKVNGHLITVPSSTIVILPANALTWSELFSQSPAPYTGQATGLALSDVPAPLGTYEVHVQGNRVGDTYIAALMWISQNFLSAGAGFINNINYDTGEMLIGGKLGDTGSGARVRINDPAININGTTTGRYTKGQTPDKRFQVDQDNPTIMAATGFPMCIPRTVDATTKASTDPLCPETNRPKDTNGNYVTIINMPDPALGLTPDATQQAPMKVGDYVTFAGTLVSDSPTQPTVSGSATTFYISAHTIVSNVAIFTAPGTNPAYCMIDVSIVGTGGPIIPGLAEAAIKDHYEGMSTDPSRGIHLWALDFDPNTGAPTGRDYGTIGVDPGPGAGGATKGRWRYRPPCNALSTNFKVCTPPKAGTFLPPPREVRAVIEDSISFTPAWKPGQTTTFANGLLAGQYHAPISTYIFPENLPGTPFREANVNGLQFLANGGYTSSTGVVAKTLNPWPSDVPPTGSCDPPVANAGGGYTVASGGTVTLDGSGSTGSNLVFSWALTLPALGTLTGPTTTKPTYTAPANRTGIDQLILMVSNACGSHSIATTVGISAPAAPTVTNVPPVKIASGAPGSISLSGSDPNNRTPLKFNVMQTGTPALTGVQITSTGGTTSTLSFSAPVISGTATPAVISLSITATNSMGTTSAAAITTVTVSAQSDTLTLVPPATYSSKQTRLSITVASSYTGSDLKVTLGPYQTQNGGTFDPSSIGPGANVFSPGGALGRWTLSLAGAPLPGSSVPVSSSLGGQLPVFVTRIK